MCHDHWPVVSDGLNGLCVAALCEVIVHLCAYNCFAFLMPRDRLVLALLRSSSSPDLKASLAACAVLCHVGMVLVTVTSSVRYKQSLCQCIPEGLCDGCCWLPL